MFVPEYLLFAILAVLGFTLGAVGVMIAFLRRQRTALIQALHQSDTRQLGMAKQLATAIEAGQRQQRQYEQQLQNMAQAILRLRQDVQLLNKRTERSAGDNASSVPERVLH